MSSKKPQPRGVSHLHVSDSAYGRLVGLVIIVDSIVAMSSSSDSRMAFSSPVQNESLLPARKTDPTARNRSPRAGASKLILNSTVSTSLSLGRESQGSVSARAIGNTADHAGMDIAVLLRESGRERGTGMWTPPG